MGGARPASAACGRRRPRGIPGPRSRGTCGHPAPATRKEGGTLRAAAVGVFLASLLVLGGSLGNDFAWDDTLLIVDNDRITSFGSTVASLGEPYMFAGELGRSVGLWRPTTTLYYGTVRAIFGLDPVAFHALNLLLHGAVSVLVLLLAARFLPRRAAVVAALVFAIHPVHVEAVANVVGAAELIPALLQLAIVLLFLRWWEVPDGASVPLALGARRVAILSGLFALAVLSKESAVVLPGVLVVLDAILGRLRWADVGAYLRARVGLGMAFLGVLAVVLVGRLQVLGPPLIGEPPVGAEVLLEMPRIWTVMTVWPHYFRLMLFPYSLSAEYAPGLLPVQFGWSEAAVLGVALVLGTLGLAWWAWRRAVAGGDARSEVVTLGVIWFAITVLPVSNLIFSSTVLLAERTLYFPSVGFALLVGWVFWMVIDGRGVPPARWLRGPAWACLGVWCAFLGLRSFARVPAWESTAAVREYLMLQHPELVRSQEMIARRLITLGEFDGAERAILSAVHIAGYPGNFNMEFQGGRMLRDMGRLELAEKFFERAVRLAPGEYERTVSEDQLDQVRQAIQEARGGG